MKKILRIDLMRWKKNIEYSKGELKNINTKYLVEIENTNKELMSMNSKYESKILEMELNLNDAQKKLFDINYKYDNMLLICKNCAVRFTMLNNSRCSYHNGEIMKYTSLLETQVEHSVSIDYI